MILVDANVLLYAYHSRSQHHARCRSWLEPALTGSDPIGLAWATIHAFLRIGTNPRAFEHPLSIGEASAIVTEWLQLPAVTIVDPGERHWEVLKKLLRDGQVSGPLVPDAALAALAVEHGAVLCSTDRDFTRFPRLRLLNPLV